jgi:hypothetical protein
MPWVDEDVVSMCDNGREYNENGDLAALQPNPIQTLWASMLM